MRVRPELPVDAILGEILSSLKSDPNLVLEAAPGAGKTTRVPPALLSIVKGEVIVLEPRRIAARLAARRVASELGEAVGETVGYQVRFEEVSGPRTRLRFVTEGILTRRLISDPMLDGVDAVVLDEFHERHLESDLALALLKRLQALRPGLRIVVMSATLDAAPVASYLGDCPVLRSEGRVFELSIRHMPYSSLPLHVQVANAMETALREPLFAADGAGNMLVFLPGVAEIRRAMRECEEVARRAGMVVLPLHGDLSAVEQDRVVAASDARKLILATNVAESSVTIEGVRVVIDSGLARRASFSTWTGLPTLSVGRVSQASAKQRAGRAGRTGPGLVLRLFSEEDLWLRPKQDTPEILRSDLSPLCLTLRVMGVGSVNKVEWLDAPVDAAIKSAKGLLDRLGAVGGMAQRMARFPLPVRLARLLIEAMDRGVGEDGCAVAAMLGSGARMARSDLLEAVEAEQDGRALQMMQQLRRLARPDKQAKRDDDALLLSVLAGYPDRVARRRAGKQVLLSSGGSAELMGDAPAYEFMVAVDAEDRTDKPMPIVRMTARIEPEWLIDLFPDRVLEKTSVVWSRERERVETVSTMLYDELVIEESRDGVPDTEAAAELLAQKALEVGIERFVDADALKAFEARVAFAGFERPDVAAAMRDVCAGLRSFAELREAAKNLIPLLEQSIGARRFEEMAPMSIRLKGGRVVKVQYDEGKQPWIQSRLQDFFGMEDTPVIGPEKTPLVVHLLAPNHRAVQTTTDLRGFWERLYPQVRRELMRRYPRHQWPEKP